MTFLERGTFAWAAAVYPLTSATTDSLLHDVDYALYKFLDFSTVVLQTHLGERWAAEATAAGLPNLASRVVQYEVPYDPAPYLTQDQLKFPLLALYRTRWKSAQTSIAFERIDSEWQLQYVLPPLEATQMERLNPILKGVMDVIVNRFHEGSDNSYRNREHVIAETGIQEITVISGKMGAYPNGKDLFFPAILMELEVKERWMPVPGAFDTLHGTDTDFGLQPTSGPVVDKFLQLKT